MSRKRKKLIEVQPSDREVVFDSMYEAMSVLSDRYRQDFPNLRVFFSYNVNGKEHIFQELKTFPLSEIHTNKTANAIELIATWFSSDKPRYYFPKDGFIIKVEKAPLVVEWEDITDNKQRHMINNVLVQQTGVVEKSWKTGTRALDITITESSNFCFRFLDVKSINMYGWGFEIISDIQSIVAVRENCLFPYLNEVRGEQSSIRSIEATIPTVDGFIENEGEGGGINQVRMVNFSEEIRNEEARRNMMVSYNMIGNCFQFHPHLKSKSVICRWSTPGYEPSHEGEDFDEYMDNLMSENKEDIKMKIKNIGQRNMSHIEIDD